MSRRASLPGAEELFRRTSEKPTPQEVDEAAPEGLQSASRQVDESPPQPATRPSPAPQSAPATPVPARSVAPARPRHDEKVTFYCTGEELTRLERARLSLRAEHGITIDRGRIVRAALEEVLEDFESRGVSSALVRKLERGE